ncbi:transposase [Labrenzia sp. THAF82]|uniref:transposase n=1 Tax=Labrenzia sp. THAF82 TaxID=2587861 RepID=UPI001FFD9078|nr:transposase [Labrenzia sp. THAF82]
MPFKHHTSRRHKFAKSRHRVANWPEYTESLGRRGDSTIWVDESVAHNWGVAHTGKRGRPGTYSDLAITACLELRTVFHLTLRQTQGFVRSLFQLMKLGLDVPDFTTLSRWAGAGLSLCRGHDPKRQFPLTLSSLLGDGDRLSGNGTAPV